VHAVDLVVHDLGLEALGVLLKSRHQVRTLDTVGVGGPIVDVGRGHKLTTRCQSGEHDRLQVGARGVDRSGVAGRTGAEDNEAGMLHSC
jgi:hypothetical protein